MTLMQILSFFYKCYGVCFLYRAINMKTLQCVNYLRDTTMSALTRNQSIIDRIFILIERAKRGYTLATVGQHGADCKVGGILRYFFVFSL